MRRSQEFMSPRYWSEPMKPGTTTTAAPSPVGTPEPRKTDDMRREIQSMPRRASRQMGSAVDAWKSSSRPSRNFLAIVLPLLLATRFLQ